MIPVIIEFLYDRAVFARAARVVLFLVASMIQQGAFGSIDGTTWWGMFFAQAAALAIKAGDRNPSPETIKEIATAPDLGKETKP